MERILVTNASGFIADQVIQYLKGKGDFVRGVDNKFPDYRLIKTDEYYKLDLQEYENCLESIKDIDCVFLINVDDVDQITINILKACKEQGIKKLICLFDPFLFRSDVVREYLKTFEETWPLALWIEEEALEAENNKLDKWELPDNAEL